MSYKHFFKTDSQLIWHGFAMLGLGILLRIYSPPKSQVYADLIFSFARMLRGVSGKVITLSPSPDYTFG